LSNANARWRSAAEQIVPRLAAIGLLLLAWWATVATGVFSSNVLPSPGAVLQAFIDSFATPDPPRESIIQAAQASLVRLVVGLSVGIVVGTVIGLAMAASALVQRSIGSLMAGLQALPSIAWLPLAILWFGLNEHAILFVVIMGAVMSIAQSTEDGVRNTPPVYLRAARNLGAVGPRLYSAVIFPAALPSIVTGMKMGWAFAWRSLMAGELLYTLPGLGNLLNMGRELNDMAQVVAVILVIITIGLVADKVVFGNIEKRVRARWGLHY
jgi:NitT/TauT family transport system permease protein